MAIYTVILNDEKLPNLAATPELNAHFNYAAT